MIRSTAYRLVVVILVFSGLFAVDSTIVIAQESQANQLTEFKIRGRSDRPITIPFELVNNLIIIEASVNGSIPLKFILDTGVENILITSLPNGEEVYLSSSRTVTLAGLGEGEPVEAFYAGDNRLNIASVEGHNVEILFLKEDIFKLSSFMGTFVHGLMGYDIFANFAVEINYLNKEIILYDPHEFEDKFRRLPNHRKWFKFPIYLEEKKPYINVGYQHKPDSPVSNLRLLIDSGSSNAFSLYSMTDKAIKIPESRINTFIGVGLSGNVNGYLGRIEKVELGDFIFDEPVIAYPDSFAIRKVFSLGNRNGSLGGEVLRRFKVIFHYRDRYILVRKNQDFRENFEYNISGIEVNTPIPNLPLYVVSQVRKNSPADREGVKKGDVIKFLNGNRAEQLSLNDILSYFQKNISSRIRMEVQRDTLYKKFSFKLDNELTIDE